MTAPITRNVLAAATLLLAPYADAASLTCTPRGAYAVSPDTLISGSANYTTTYPNPVYPGLLISTSGTSKPTILTTDIVMESLSITDSSGKNYPVQPGRNIFFGPIWWGTSRVAKGTTLTYKYSFRINPAAGALASNYPFDIVIQATEAMDNTGPSFNQSGILARVPATPYGTNTIIYTTPDQHTFGDITPNSPGVPLVLPPPAFGSLSANVLWSGPINTSMTAAIGGGSPTTIPSGIATQLSTAGQGLQVELTADETAPQVPYLATSL